MFALMVAIAVITFFEIFNVDQYDDEGKGFIHVIAYGTLFGFVIHAIFNWI